MPSLKLRTRMFLGLLLVIAGMAGLFVRVGGGSVGQEVLRKTVEAMIRLYCHDEHQTPAGLCPECAELQDYAGERLTRCPYQPGKTTCAKCPIHCYKPAMRDEIRAVMRYAGPRMITRHPLLALYHLFDGRRKEPVRPTRGNQT